MTAESIHDKEFNGVFWEQQSTAMHDGKMNFKKQAPGAAQSNEGVKSAQRKLAGRDGGAGMTGKKNEW